MLRHSVYTGFLLVILLSSCTMSELIYPKRGNYVHKAPEHHAHQDVACASCHGIDKPQPVSPFAEGIDPSTRCLDCHDYETNHHPVNFAPADPAHFPLPLYEGKVRCQTCHEMHGGPEKKGTKRLLRGGPYPDRRQICFRCHIGQYTGINPHHMIDSSNKIRSVRGKPVCLYCHSSVPDPSVDTTETVGFRADVGFLCWRCHPPMPDEFFDKHFLITPSEQTLENMWETQIRNDVILPIVPRYRITCSTFHKPRQKGVLQRQSAAKGADERARLRLNDICTACHRM